jgi:hypothetical protein
MSVKHGILLEEESKLQAFENKELWGNLQTREELSEKCGY